MAVLRVRKGARPGAVFPLFTTVQPTTIGREGPVDVPLGDPKASRRHAAVRLEGGEWVIEDLKSSNGTYLNTQRVDSAKLVDGSAIQIGGTLLGFHERDAPPTPPFEIHGTMPAEALRETCGVIVLRARQPALDREVRVDWLHPSREVSSAARRRIERAFAEAQNLSDDGLAPLVGASLNGGEPHGEAGEGASCALFRGVPWPSIEDRLDQVLRLGLADRVHLFRLLVEAGLLRATWESLRSPVGLRQVEVHLQPGGMPVIRLPALDLSALAAEESGRLADLPWIIDYVPPEQLDGGSEGGARVGDEAASAPLAGAMYNLGALGYHLLTGQKPMGRGPAAVIAQNHRAIRPAPPALLDASIPAALSAMVERMLEKDPAKRPQGRQEVLSAFPSVHAPALDAAASVEEPPAPPRTSPPRAEPRRSAARAAPTPPRLPASPAPAPTPASRPAQRAKPQPGAAARRTDLVYLPVWVVAWLVLFFAARYLSVLLFRELGG